MKDFLVKVKEEKTHNFSQIFKFYDISLYPSQVEIDSKEVIFKCRSRKFFTGHTVILHENVEVENFTQDTQSFFKKSM